jgi:hypothetical protein
MLCAIYTKVSFLYGLPDIWSDTLNKFTEPTQNLPVVSLCPSLDTVPDSHLLSYAEPDVDKFDMSNHVHVWDHSYSTSIQSVEENCTHDHSYVKNTSVAVRLVLSNYFYCQMRII